MGKRAFVEEIEVLGINFAYHDMCKRACIWDISRINLLAAAVLQVTFQNIN